MRRMISALVLCTLLLALVPAAVLADGMIFPESISPDYLEVRYHHVTVTIVDNHAVTRVEQEFVNPHDFPVDGRYFFPVPPDAILAAFEATVGGQAQAVTRQDAATTNAALYDMVAQRRDSSLLQYADWESMAFDISLPARASRKMTLEYEQVLAPTGGMLHYRYILSTERCAPAFSNYRRHTIRLFSMMTVASPVACSDVSAAWIVVSASRKNCGAANVTP